MSAAAVLRACSLLLCLVAGLAGSQQLSLTELVVPYAVEAGENAELQCRYALAANASRAALYVKWWWTPAGATPLDKKHIYQHIAENAAETVQRNKTEIKENDTIVLQDVTPSDSGTYECEVSNIDEVRQHGELIVYTKGTGPQLNISSVAAGSEGGENLLIECEAAEVAPLPHLIVTMSNGNEISMTEVLTGPSREGLYNISATSTALKVDVVPGDISCELHYENPKISHPKYTDVETYTPAAGAGEPPASESPGVAPAPAPTEVSPESLPNSRDAGYRAQCSWALPVVAAILVHLHAIL